MRILPAGIFLYLLVTSISVFASVQQGNTSSQQGCDREPGTVAIIESGRSITLEEVDKAIGRQLQSLKERIYSLRRTALESMITHAILEASARREGVTVEQFTRALMSSEPQISEQRIAEIFSENESALATLGEDEAKAKVRLDLENQMRLSALHAALADLRAKARVKICLDEPIPPALEISDRGPSLGPPDAAVTIYEYSDFQCPYCRQAKSVIEKILKSNEGKVRLVFKQLPLPIHPQAFAAATAAYCAHEQGRFWPFHDRLFEANDLSVESLTRQANDVGLDMGRFASCIGSEAARSEVLRDVQESRKAGFTGTPTFVINGRPLRGAAGVQEFQRAIDLELQKRKEEQRK